MAEQLTLSRPVQVFLDTEQFFTVPERRGRTGNRDFYEGNNHGFFNHKSAMCTKIRDAAETLRRRNQAAGIVIVQMRKNALAKSYRPLSVLFSRTQSFGLVGGGRVGEKFFQCTPYTLDRLDRRIEERAEIEPRVTGDINSGKLIARPSTYRSELSGIEDIRLPTGFDRISFSAREAYDWFNRPNTLGAYVVDIFQPDPELDRAVIKTMIEHFRERLNNLGGIVALPLFPVKGKRSNGHLTMAIHLTDKLDQSFIEFPLDSRFPTRRELPRNMLRLNSRDVSIERHQEFLQQMEDEPLIRRINLPPSFEVAPIETSQTPQIVVLPAPQIDTPVVDIIDGGIADLPVLSAWRSGGTESVEPADRDDTHGTFIAGPVVGGRSLNPRIATTIEPEGSRYFDIPLLPKQGLFSNYYAVPSEFFEQLEEEVIRAKSDANVRVFNLSLGVFGMRRNHEYSIFAQAPDYIATEHNVLFVVSAGNLRGTDEHPPWPTDSDDALRSLALHPTVDDRIIAPGEHLPGLTVGALNTPGIAGHGAGLPASYTRRGPGIGGMLKPDLTHYGGVAAHADSNSGLFSFSSDNRVVDISGTSFATPLVASTLATIDHRLVSLQM